jgi:type IV pilus assembly protein PilY1
MVYFGTGQYLTRDDNSTTQTQEIYGVWDKGESKVNSSQLVEQTITETTTLIDGVSTDVRIMSTNAVNYASKYGWRIELPTSKERNVVDVVVLENILFFSPLIPGTNGVCSGNAEGWYMAVDAATGGKPDFVVWDLNNDGDFDGEDMAGSDVVSGVHTDKMTVKQGFIQNGNKVIDLTPGSGTGSGMSTQVGGDDDVSRMSWSTLED